MVGSSETPDLLSVGAYDFELPDAQIAAQPAERRTASRLLELDGDGSIHHRVFSDIRGQLRPGDLLVRNNVRVVPARLEGRKPSGGKVELLALAPLDGDWQTDGPGRFSALGKASKPIKPGLDIVLDQATDTVLRVDEKRPDGTLIVSWESSCNLLDLLERAGQMPLPPYIVKSRQEREEALYSESDRERYQTVYSQTPGAVAAPTAGLHFDTQLLGELESDGVEIRDVTLDVGVGTFRPVSAERIDSHEMHTESYTVTIETAEALRKALAEGRRILCVGTTSMRVVEDLARRFGEPRPGRYETDIFLHPGVEIRWTQGLITNFHLPKSTLLMLVCALGGYSPVMAAYRAAVSSGYRFYSYGDA
ncbi:MAG: tRNA preQ1(34) S-adenosylmethionine ribosyltransferase-isomerase QueA, partial [Myxococcales bacterium]|nr:tRNA preQ1(34) S-adenosylmethionine ribosyltransferase-isomerase QueA [Myxococcales bacterium]